MRIILIHILKTLSIRHKIWIAHYLLDNYTFPENAFTQYYGGIKWISLLKNDKDTSHARIDFSTQHLLIKQVCLTAKTEQYYVSNKLFNSVSLKPIRLNMMYTYQDAEHINRVLSDSLKITVTTLNEVRATDGLLNDHFEQWLLKVIDALIGQLIELHN